MSGVSRNERTSEVYEDLRKVAGTYGKIGLVIDDHNEMLDRVAIEIYGVTVLPDWWRAVKSVPDAARHLAALAQLVNEFDDSALRFIVVVDRFIPVVGSNTIDWYDAARTSKQPDALTMLKALEVLHTKVGLVQKPRGWIYGVTSYQRREQPEAVFFHTGDFTLRERAELFHLRRAYESETIGFAPDLTLFGPEGGDGVGLDRDRQLPYREALEDCIELILQVSKAHRNVTFVVGDCFGFVRQSQNETGSRGIGIPEFAALTRGLPRPSGGRRGALAKRIEQLVELDLSTEQALLDPTLRKNLVSAPEWFAEVAAEYRRRTRLPAPQHYYLKWLVPERVISATSDDLLDRLPPSHLLGECPAGQRPAEHSPSETKGERGLTVESIWPAHVPTFEPHNLQLKEQGQTGTDELRETLRQTLDKLKILNLIVIGCTTEHPLAICTSKQRSEFRQLVLGKDNQRPCRIVTVDCAAGERLAVDQETPVENCLTLHFRVGALTFMHDLYTLWSRLNREL